MAEGVGSPGSALAAGSALSRLASGPARGALKAIPAPQEREPGYLPRKDSSAGGRGLAAGPQSWGMGTSDQTSKSRFSGVLSSMSPALMWTTVRLAASMT
eukprot:679970-Hanusia_phi.AAC.1